MKSGSKQCPSCGSRFTFEDYELVDSMPADAPCLGCERLYAILAESSRLRGAPMPAPEVMDLSPAGNLGRLLAFRRREPEPFDAKKAAAGERE